MIRKFCLYSRVNYRANPWELGIVKMVFVMVLELNLFQSLNVNAKVIDPYHWKFSNIRLTDMSHMVRYTWDSFWQYFFWFSLTFLKVEILALNKAAGMRQFEEAVSERSDTLDRSYRLPDIGQTRDKSDTFFISGPIILLRWGSAQLMTLKVLVIVSAQLLVLCLTFALHSFLTSSCSQYQYYYVWQFRVSLDWQMEKQHESVEAANIFLHTTGLSNARSIQDSSVSVLILDSKISATC